MNELFQIAAKDGRDYITPEDVSEGLKTIGIQRTRVCTLECLGQKRAEDWALCAFVAWNALTEEDAE